MYKEIPGYKNYLISRSGLIFSKKHNKILKFEITNKNGYHRVKLYNGSSFKKILVHRLVALTYIKNIENKPYINHKNFNKKDNRVLNLEWVTHIENVRYKKQISNKILPVGITFLKRKKIYNARYGQKHLGGSKNLSIAISKRKKYMLNMFGDRYKKLI